MYICTYVRLYVCTSVRVYVCTGVILLLIFSPSHVVFFLNMYYIYISIPLEYSCPLGFGFMYPMTLVNILLFILFMLFMSILYMGLSENREPRNRLVTSSSPLSPIKSKFHDVFSRIFHVQWFRHIPLMCLAQSLRYSLKLAWTISGWTQKSLGPSGFRPSGAKSASVRQMLRVTRLEVMAEGSGLAQWNWWFHLIVNFDI